VQAEVENEGNEDEEEDENLEGDPVAREEDDVAAEEFSLDEDADDSADGVMVITSVAAIVLFVIMLVCIKQVYDRFYKLSAIKLRQQQLQIEEVDDIKRAEMKGNAAANSKEKDGKIIEPDRSASKAPLDGTDLSQYTSNNLVQYEQQYDPNQDFAVFGVGNEAMGGFMTQQEKENAAERLMTSDAAALSTANKMLDSSERPAKTPSLQS